VLLFPRELQELAVIFKMCIVATLHKLSKIIVDYNMQLTNCSFDEEENEMRRFASGMLSAVSVRMRGEMIVGWR
jgi:hypothetical protein